MNHLVYFVVGDKKLNSGNGIYVKDLEGMKARLMKLSLTGKWRLIISIHGSEDVIATQGGYLRSRSAKGAYEADDLKKLFGDADFDKWRKAHGPSWTTLNACQVNLPFEKVLLTVLNKPGSTQKAQGLGQACRPYTDIMYYIDAKKRAIRNKNQWRRLSKTEKKEMEEMLKELNRKFGYFGTPPIDESLLIHYYFEEEPLGGWPTVTVSYNRQDTGISFQNRTQNARFLKTCTKHIGPMRDHKASVPSVPD